MFKNLGNKILRILSHLTMFHTIPDNPKECEALLEKWYQKNKLQSRIYSILFGILGSFLVTDTNLRWFGVILFGYIIVNEILLHIIQVEDRKESIQRENELNERITALEEKLKES